MTYLEHLHPYPAMLPSTLAQELCDQLDVTNKRVLDPFCGSGRVLMAAAAKGADAVGVDVNPLAVLISDAKSKIHYPAFYYTLISELKDYQLLNRGVVGFDLQPGRKVDWFSKTAAEEFCTIITYLNEKELDDEQLTFCAAVLSATVRDASYCRKNGWKLHRLSASDRSTFSLSPINIFTRRLKKAADEMRHRAIRPGNARAILGNTTILSEVLHANSIKNKFDAVITSPPYGDSFTTVQYGGISSLCLGVIRNIKNLRYFYEGNSTIDNNCLGGQSTITNDRFALDLKKYWNGRKESRLAITLEKFLHDLRQCCSEISTSIKPNGKAAIVVSRRSIDGWRLYIDKFICDTMFDFGLELQSHNTRSVENKFSPRRLDRMGKSKEQSAQVARSIIPTMHCEHILIFKKTG